MGRPVGYFRIDNIQLQEFVASWVNLSTVKAQIDQCEQQAVISIPKGILRGFYIHPAIFQHLAGHLTDDLTATIADISIVKSSRACRHDNCTIRASYGTLGTTRPTHCAKHGRKIGLVNVRHKRCERQRTQASATSADRRNRGVEDHRPYTGDHSVAALLFREVVDLRLHQTRYISRRNSFMRR